MTLVPPAPGDPRVGPYALVRLLGRGGMGEVHLATAPGGRPVAVKLLQPHLATDAEWLARLRDEVAAARRVSAWSTAAVLDADLDASPPYVVSEYVEGPTLAEHVASSGALPASDVHAVALGIATALVGIHDAGVVHRDLKPSNVVLSRSGPRVIDFGIALHDNRAVAPTAAGVVVGSPGWMAPEQVAGGAVTAAVDVFAWGALVCYAATGRPPYGTGDPIAVAYRVVHQAPEVAGLPPLLGPVVEAAMSRDPALRPTARGLVGLLLQGEPGGSPGQGPEAAAAARGTATAAGGTAVTGGAAAGGALGQAAVTTVIPAPPPPPGAAVPAAPPSIPAPPSSPAPPVAQPGGLGATGVLPPGMAGPAGQPRRPWHRRALVLVPLCTAAVVAVGAVMLVASDAPLLSGDVVEPGDEPLSGRDGPAAAPDGDGEAPPEPEQEAPPEPEQPDQAEQPASAQAGVLLVEPAAVSCGAATLGEGFLVAEAEGQYCLVTVEVTNTGDEPAGFDMGPQRALDGAGVAHAADGFAWVYHDPSRRFSGIDPGSTVSGDLVFDVPEGTVLVELVVRDGWLGGETTVGLPG